MKRLAFLLILLLALPMAAMAEMAEDITNECIVNNRTYNKFAPDDIRDRDFITFYSGSAMTINAPEGKKIGAVEIKWRTITPPAAIVKVQQQGKWVEVLRQGPDYATQYLELPEPQSTVRIVPQKGKLELCEITVLTPGEAPDYVQRWHEPPEKVDLMLFSTHPDDEVLWFGGLLPTYAGERKLRVQVAVMVPTGGMRKLELLHRVSVFVTDEK